MGDLTDADGLEKIFLSKEYSLKDRWKAAFIFWSLTCGTHFNPYFDLREESGAPSLLAMGAVSDMGKQPLPEWLLDFNY